ncbi:MAG TPA: hypothetical protein VGG91_10755 [Myxococcaceae bacterium]
MPAVSLLVLTVLAQPVAHRVEVADRDGEVFLSAGALGSDLWERGRGDAHLEARRSSDGEVSAELTLSLLRGAERWTVELSRLRPGGIVLDADLAGPGGLVHAAVALGGTARVTRAGEVISDTAAVRVVALTTGYHADDGTFRTLRAGRSGDLELLVSVDWLPGGGTLELGVEHPEIRIDGRSVWAAPLADATAPPWPGASREGPGVGGAGSSNPAPYGPVPPLSPPSSQAGSSSGTALPTTPPPANAAPAGPLPATPAPANTGPAASLPQAPAPANAGAATPLPATPTPPMDAPVLPQAPAPGNSGPALPLPGTPAPANSAPALPLPATPAPLHGRTDPPGPTWFPAPLPPSPVPDTPSREIDRPRLARAGSKIDPSGQASTVPVRVQLRACALDLSRHVPRIAIADRG